MLKGSLIGGLEQGVDSGAYRKSGFLSTTVDAISFRASLHAFQKPENAETGISADNLQLRHSTILTYTGIDKREGLVTIAKRLLRSMCFVFLGSHSF